MPSLQVSYGHGCVCGGFRLLGCVANRGGRTLCIAALTAENGLAPISPERKSGTTAVKNALLGEGTEGEVAISSQEAPNHYQPKKKKDKILII